MENESSDSSITISVPTTDRSTPTSGSRKPPPIELELDVSLSDIYTGTVLQQPIEKQMFIDDDVVSTSSSGDNETNVNNNNDHNSNDVNITTDQVAGTVTLNVPVEPGTLPGARIILKGMGTRGDPPGDIHFIVREQPSNGFSRIGRTFNLLYQAKISAREAILGGKLKMVQLDGSVLYLPFEGGVKPGSEFEVLGRGLPCDERTVFIVPERPKVKISARKVSVNCRRGDLVVRFEIDLPNNSNSETIERPLERSLSMLSKSPSCYNNYSNDAAAVADKESQLEKLPPNRFPLPLRLEEQFHGCEKYRLVVVKLTDKDGTITTDEKVVKVIVPPGATNSVIVPLEGDWQYGKVPADLEFRIHPLEHHRFERCGTADLLYRALVTPEQAVLGGTVAISTLDGQLLHHTFEGGRKQGDTFRLVGHGMRVKTRVDRPGGGAQRRGDLIVSVQIEL